MSNLHSATPNRCLLRRVATAIGVWQTPRRKHSRKTWRQITDRLRRNLSRGGAAGGAQCWGRGVAPAAVPRRPLPPPRGTPRGGAVRGRPQRRGGLQWWATGVSGAAVVGGLGPGVYLRPGGGEGGRGSAPFAGFGVFFLLIPLGGKGGAPGEGRLN